MAARPRVLVTTPNGRTGSAAVSTLLSSGYPVRALVRRDDARAARLRARGAEVVVGDLLDWRDLQRAVRDVQRIYHCPPFDSRHLHGAALLALAAEEAGVEVVALMSGWNPHPTHPSVMQREHWLANNLFRRLPAFDVIHINPGLFAFTYLLGLPAIHHFGRLMLPYGEGLCAPPSSEDIGAVAAHALMDPAPYVGRCLRPTGPALLSGHDVAGALERVMGRSVRYAPVSGRFFSRVATVSGFPPFQIAQVVRYAEECASGAFAQPPTDVVEAVTGRPAEDFESLSRRYLSQPSLIWPGLSAGTLAEALWFGVRLALTRAPDLAAWEASRDYPQISGGELAHESVTWRAAASAGRLVLLPEDALSSAASG